jgi:hypothetical protein
VQILLSAPAERVAHREGDTRRAGAVGRARAPERKGAVTGDDEQRRSSEGRDVEVEPHEIQARAMIAAALITSHAVEVPTIPRSGDWSQETAALRLRELTDYIYLMLTTAKS